MSLSTSAAASRYYSGTIQVTYRCSVQCRANIAHEYSLRSTTSRRPLLLSRTTRSEGRPIQLTEPGYLILHVFRYLFSNSSMSLAVPQQVPYGTIAVLGRQEASIPYLLLYFIYIFYQLSSLLIKVLQYKGRTYVINRKKYSKVSYVPTSPRNTQSIDQVEILVLAVFEGKKYIKGRFDTYRRYYYFFCLLVRGVSVTACLRGRVFTIYRASLCYYQFSRVVILYIIVQQLFQLRSGAYKLPLQHLSGTLAVLTQ